MALRLRSVFCGRSWLLSRHVLPPAVCPVRTKTAKQLIHEREDNSLAWAEGIVVNKGDQKTIQSEETTEKKEPHMLHVVWRLKSLKGRPWWEKEIMERLLLNGPMHKPVVHKNIPAVNKKLRVVKHLVRILPLTFPHGLPEHESDFDHAFIKTSGELVLKKRLQEFEPEPDQEDERQKWRMELDTVKKVMLRKIQRHAVYSEYHKSHEVYELNQDGKEYRYNFNEIDKKGYK